MRPLYAAHAMTAHGSKLSWAVATPAARPDLNELRGFCVAADLGSLGRAAVRLRVSQPSLSKRLASLEAKVGARLLERSARGVALTPAGRRLYRARAPAARGRRPGGRGHGRASARPAPSCAWPPATRRARRSSRRCSTRAQRAPAARRRAGDRQLAGRARAGRRRPRRPRRRRLAAQPHAQPGRARDRARRRRDRLRGPARPPVGRAWHGDRKRFLATPMVVRDPSSNARWTVDAVLAADDLARRPAAGRGRHPARRHRRGAQPPRAGAPQPPRDRPDRLHPVAVEGLAFPRSYVLVTPAYGEADRRGARARRAHPRAHPDLAALTWAGSRTAPALGRARRECRRPRGCQNACRWATAASRSPAPARRSRSAASRAWWWSRDSAARAAERFTATGRPSGRPSAPVTTILSPCDGLGAGKLAGWTRRSRASQRAASAPATRTAASSASSGRRVVAGGLDDDDQQPEHHHQQRDDAVEAAGLRVRPRVQRPDDLAPVVGVGARAPCAGRRCRRAPWRGSAPAGARRRTRAATGARPPGTPSGRGPRRRRSRRCGSAASAGGCGPTATRGRTRRR